MNSSHANATMQDMNLTELRQLVDRADLLLQREYKALKSHWNADKCGFHTCRKSRDGGRINITTTCFGLFAISRNSSLIDKFFGGDDGKADATALDKIAVTLATTPWTSEGLADFNIYTTPIVVATIYRLIEDPVYGPSVLEAMERADCKTQIRNGLQAIVKSVSEHGVARYPPYEASAYLGYWCFEAFRRKAASREHEKNEERQLSEECANLTDRLAVWGEGELYRQLAFHSAGDMAMFDPTQLAYTLKIYTEHRSAKKEPVNQKVVERAMEVVFAHQEEDGLWPKSRPIFHFAALGSVYPFTFEMLDVLIPAEPSASLFRPHLGRLESALRWAEDNYIDGDEEKGWRSSHIPSGSDPHGWSTAALFLTIRKIRAVMMAQIREDLLEEFRAQRNDAPDATPLSPDKFYDTDVPPKAGESLKSVLKKYLIDPHKAGGSTTDRRYSAVFYGPPGTAKTTMATAVAKALGWPYIYLQTSDFAGEGVNQVIGKARNIFDRLALLERAVVLFDEVEEFVRDRTKESEPSSRMLTTSMLSLIQELRSKEGIIFIVATNFLDKFDSAITRTGGRFDMMVLISPPSKEEKKRLFRERLALKIPLEKATKFHGQMDAYVDTHFDDRFERFAFTEWKLMADEIVGCICERGKWDEKAIEAIATRRQESIALNDNELMAAFKASSSYVRF